MPKVNIQGVGVVNFPDSMTTEQIQSAIEKDIIPNINLSKEEKYDPTQEMSTTEKLLAGAGKAFSDIGRGAKQLVAATEEKIFPESVVSGLRKVRSFIGIDPSSSTELAKQQEESNRLDKPLLATGAGLAGNVVGNIAAALPVAFIPGVNTYTGAALMGGGLGAVQPTTDAELLGKERLQNIGTGAVFSVAGKGIADVIGKGIRGIKALGQPFTESGQEEIVKNAINVAASDPGKARERLLLAQNLLKGSEPTTAQIAQDVGIARLEKGLGQASPNVAQQLSDRALEQNAARLKALQAISGDDVALEMFKKQRGEIAGDLYKKAYSVLPELTPELEKKQAELFARPAIQSALKEAEQLAANEGIDIGIDSVKKLHYAKLSLDDQIDKAIRTGDNNLARVLGNSKDKLVSFIEDISPTYKEARIAFQKLSEPVNQMQIGQEILSKATKSQIPNRVGDFTIYPSNYANALKSGDVLARTATGIRKPLESVMTPEQMNILNAIKDDVSREINTKALSSAAGSDTAQNLATQNLLNKLGVSDSLSNNALLRTVTRPLDFIYRSAEPKIQERLARALLDPKDAAKLMQAPSSERKILIKKLLDFIPQSTGYSVSTNQ